MSSTAVAKRQQVQSFIEAINEPAYKAQRLAPAALAGWPDPDVWVRRATSYIQMYPDVVTKATVSSLHIALVRGYEMGLMIDGREAALILFGNEARLMPMFQGLRTIAAKHGCSLRAEVVYAEDTFGYNLGLSPSLKHVPAALGTDRGLPIGAYAVAKHKTFGVFVEVMSVDEIERVRQISRASSTGPWVDWWPEMARKTVGRRLFKSLPLVADEQIRSMLEADDATNDLTTNEPEVPADLSVPAEAAFADFEQYDDTPVWDPADDPESEAGVGSEVPASPAAGEAGASDSTSPGVQPSFAEMAERAQQRGRKPAEALEPELDNQ